MHRRDLAEQGVGLAPEGYAGVHETSQLQHVRLRPEQRACTAGPTDIHPSRYFSANYAIVVALLGVYSLLTNPLLLIALAFLIGGFLAIGRFGASPLSRQTCC